MIACAAFGLEEVSGLSDFESVLVLNQSGERSIWHFSIRAIIMTGVKQLIICDILSRYAKSGFAEVKCQKNSPRSTEVERGGGISDERVSRCMSLVVPW